jgi:hypothetical protein
MVSLAAKEMWYPGQGKVLQTTAKKTNRDRDHAISVCTRMTVMNHKTPKVG